MTGVAMDRFYKIREGDTTARAWNPPTFKLPALDLLTPPGAAWDVDEQFHAGA